MQTSSLELILSSLHLLLYIGSGIILDYLVCSMMLYKRHSCIVFACVYSCKTIVINLLPLVLPGSYIASHAWFSTFIAALNVVYFLGNYFILYYTFKASLGKLIAVTWISETTSLIVPSLVLLLCNKVTGRSNSVYHFVPLHIIDILIPLSCVLYYKCLKKYMGKYLNKIRDLKFPRILEYILIIVCVINSAYSIYAHYLKTVKAQLVSPSLLRLIIAVTIALFLFFLLIICLDHRKITIEKEYLTQEKSLLLSNQAAFDQQVLRSRETNRILGQQMEQFLASDVSQIPEHQLQEYIGQLKKAYQDIKLGIYCNDFVIDSILSSEKERFEKDGITFSCTLPGYQRGTIDETDFSILLMIIFEAFHTNAAHFKNNSCSITLSTVSDQLIFKISGILSKRAFKKLCHRTVSITERYNGLLRQDTSDVSFIAVLGTNCQTQ